MQCVRVGFGSVAPLHEQKLALCHVTTAGVIETNPAKRKAGVLFCESYEDAYSLRPLFWDVCTPNDQHLPVIERIIALDPTANIIVEKPLCNFDQMDRLKEVLKGFRGRLVVNENYESSGILVKVKEIVARLGLTIKKIIVEFDKNRTKDFQDGRARAKTAFWYEGPHMITVEQSIGSEFLPNSETVIETRFEGIEIPDKDGIKEPEILERQGLADFSYEINGVAVNLFTSMKGDIKHRLGPHCPAEDVPARDTATRYRIVAVEGTNLNNEVFTVVGYFEPIRGFDRSKGSVVVLKDGNVLERHEPIEDDTMGKNLQRAVEHFQGGPNPCGVEQGLKVVTMMQQLEAAELRDRIPAESAT